MVGDGGDAGMIRLTPAQARRMGIAQAGDASPEQKKRKGSAARRPTEPFAVQFTVYGQAVPKARARVPNEGHAYTPDDTAAWERSVQIQAMRYRPKEPLDGPVMVAMAFYLKRPKRSKDDQLPDVKPDWDNLAKAICDALSGMFWTNDSRIVDGIVSKRYGEPPRVELFIRSIEGE